ncbi:MAG: hypothetical protein ACYTG0_14995 [Planctomycetota bacterium]|jgi:hypothetical protein
MKMKRICIVLLLSLTVGCAAREAEPSRSGIVPGVKQGRRRDAGHDFYTIDVRTKNPPGHWEEYHWGRDLYFKRQKIDEADPPDVCPSGRYAVYESAVHGGIVLFDSHTHRKLRVLERGTVPNVASWSDSETSFVITYYVSGNESRTVTIEIKKLKAVEEEAEEPPAGDVLMWPAATTQ